jgi:hypothetical protein
MSITTVAKRKRVDGYEREEIKIIVVRNSMERRRQGWLEEMEGIK